jgi:hypothetical protein
LRVKVLRSTHNFFCSAPTTPKTGSGSDHWHSGGRSPQSLLNLTLTLSGYSCTLSAFVSREQFHYSLYAEKTRFGPEAAAGPVSNSREEYPNRCWATLRFHYGPRPGRLPSVHPRVMHITLRRCSCGCPPPPPPVTPLPPRSPPSAPLAVPMGCFLGHCACGLGGRFGSAWRLSLARCADAARRRRGPYVRVL